MPSCIFCIAKRVVNQRSPAPFDAEAQNTLRTPIPQELFLSVSTWGLQCCPAHRETSSENAIHIDIRFHTFPWVLQLVAAQNASASTRCRPECELQQHCQIALQPWSCRNMRIPRRKPTRAAFVASDGRTRQTSRVLSSLGRRRARALVVFR